MRVGRIVRVFTDDSRIEQFNDSGEKRRVIVSIFYPVDCSWNTDRQALYSDLFKPSQERFIKAWVDKGTKEDDIRSLTTNIYTDAPIDKTRDTYPVILYSHGCTFDRDSTTFCIEKLVSEGYIVITIGALYESEFTVLADGEVIEMDKGLDKDDFTHEEWCKLRDIRKKDIIYILNQLENLNRTDAFIKGKLDLDKIGIMGFSLGAVASFEVAADDDRIKAAALLEGCMFFSTIDSRINACEGLNTPLILIKRHDSTYQQMVDKTKGWFEDLECSAFKKELKLIENISNTQEQLYAYLNGYKSFVKVQYTNHITFSDYYILANKNQIEYCGGKINIERAHKIISETVTRFFNEFIRGKSNEYQDFINKNVYEELKVINASGEII